MPCLVKIFTNRTQEEIEILFDLYVQGLNEISVDPLIHENGVRVNAVGSRFASQSELEMQYPKLRRLLVSTRITFTVCLAYGGREEIIDAVKSLARDHAEGDLEIDSIDANAISSRLYTSELPDPHLVIRTSGEERISNFSLADSIFRIVFHRYSLAIFLETGPVLGNRRLCF